MKIKTLYLNFFVLIYLISQASCQKVPQIKVVGTQISSLNRDYISKLVYTINRFNATFNYLKLFMKLKKNLPADLKLYTKVYITTSTYQKGTLALDNVTPVCEPSDHRELLFSIFQIPDRDLHTQCIREGTYVLPNLEQFRFEVLIPDIEKKGLYYRVDYKFGNNDTVISAATFYSEWGYHETF